MFESSINLQSFSKILGFCLETAWRLWRPSRRCNLFCACFWVEWWTAWQRGRTGKRRELELGVFVCFVVFSWC